MAQFMTNEFKKNNYYQHEPSTNTEIMFLY